MNRSVRRVFAGGSLIIALLLAGCSDANGDSEDPAETGMADPGEPDNADGPPVDHNPDADENDGDELTDDNVDETADVDVEGDVDEESADAAGEEPGVVLLAEPITFAENGLELEVDAVRIIAIQELEEIAGEDFSEFLDDQSAVTFVGMRVTVRNTTDAPVDWYPGGASSAIVLEGQQGGPNFMGDWGDTIRAGAERELNVYYESRVPVDEARAAGELVWDAGAAYDEDYNALADPELTISYAY